MPPPLPPEPRVDKRPVPAGAIDPANPVAAADGLAGLALLDRYVDKAPPSP